MSIVTVQELADRLNVTRFAIFRMIQRGRLQATKVGPIYVIDQADADALAASYKKWGRA